MIRRLIGLQAVLGIVLFVAVGPGLTLSRCRMTGRVYLSCCCTALGAATAPSSLGDIAEGCCSVQRLTTPWRSAVTSAPVAVALPILATWTPLLQALPSNGRFVSRTNAPQGKASPRWLEALRI